MNTILCTTSTFNALDAFDAYKDKLTVLVNPYKRKLTEEELYNLILEHQPVGIIAGVEPITKAVLSKAKNLKVISRAGVGMDSVDLEAASSKGIIVTNTPDAPTVPVAELTLGLILSVLRGITYSDSSIRKQEWNRPMGWMLSGKTVGIIGCGRIGTYVARLCSAFNCKLLGFDKYVKSHEYCKMVPLDRLLVESDIITLHVPYDAETHKLIGKEALALLKPTAVLINTSRGGLIDENALYFALKEGKIAGAALDCFEEEPYKGPLNHLNNVVLTAHIGSYAREARLLQERQAAENMIEYLKKQGVL
jgi:D-3-phosphoglycerate dehydrogenase